MSSAGYTISYFAQLHFAVLDVLAPGVFAVGTVLLPPAVPGSRDMKATLPFIFPICKHIEGLDEEKKNTDSFFYFRQELMNYFFA